MQTVVERLIKSTIEYENKYDKKLRKEHGQFFTPINIAQYMSEIFNIDGLNDELKILDPSGGTGILSVVLLLHILKNSNIQKVIIDIYENDDNVLPILYENIEIIKNEYHKAKRIINVTIYNKNFITFNKNNNYDFIIGNPPYKKINKDTEEALTVGNLLYGQPNIYMIFMVHSLKLLNKNGQMVFIVPRSFFNGKYFHKFRKCLYKKFSITYIHSFESRSEVFEDRVLQEFIIIKIENRTSDTLLINYSNDERDIDKNKAFKIYNNIVWDKDLRIRLPLNNLDVELLRLLDKSTLKIKDLSLVFKTGPIVDFRIKQGLYKKKTKDSVPLIWCANFDLYKIKWPIKNIKYEQYISYNFNKNSLLPMDNYIFVKRFASKEEKKILKINILAKNDLPYNYIGIENHVNYIKFGDKKSKLMKGVFILLNSNLYNRYFKIINGTTQINTSDLNDLPILSYELLEKLSEIDINYEKLTSDKCDDLIKFYFNIC